MSENPEKPQLAQDANSTGSEPVKPDKNDDEKLDYRVVGQTIRTFARHYVPYKKTLAFAFLCLVLSVFLAALVPWPLKLILDQVLLDEPLFGIFEVFSGLFVYPKAQLLFWLSASIVFIAILNAVISYFNKYLISACSTMMQADIRERVFERLQRMSLSFHESARSGNMIYLITNDVNTMKTILLELPQDLLHRGGTVLLFTILMALLDWRLCLMGIAVLPLIYFVIRVFGRRMRDAMRKRRAREAEIASLISENVQSIALVQAYGRQEKMQSRFDAESEESLQAQVRFLKLTRRFSRTVDFFSIASMTAVLYFGGKYGLNSALSPGILVLLIKYVTDLHGTMSKFNELYEKLVGAQAAAKRLLEFVGQDDLVEDAPGAVQTPTLKGAVEFDKVNFAYASRSKDVLNDVSFSVKPGQRVAIVGPSGAGKSTIISLLMRFYNPKSGEIRLDGTDIRKYTIRSVREQITILLQDARLFQTSVHENILFGRPNATEAQIIEAAKQAEAHEFISALPEGYATIIDEGADTLSGGQRQRINIARAIIRNTPIVILDEPMSGLDALAERKVQSALQHLTAGKTSFTIAHKLATVMDADLILLVENGRIAAAGKHETLMKTAPAYQDLFSLQAGMLSMLDEANPTDAENEAAGANGSHTGLEQAT